MEIIDTIAFHACILQINVQPVIVKRLS